ncbi:MAG: hypothetical protein ACOVLH_02115 [Roseateles sp.]
MDLVASAIWPSAPVMQAQAPRLLQLIDRLRAQAKPAQLGAGGQASGHAELGGLRLSGIAQRMNAAAKVQLVLRMACAVVLL